MSEPVDPTDVPSPDDNPDDAPGGGTGIGAALVAFLVIALVGVGAFVGGLLLLGGDEGDDGPQQYVVDIPEGTSDRMARGEAVELIPSTLELDVGDTIVIVNNDARPQEVGPFNVRAGETLRYTFDRAGTYLGNCTVHPSGKVEIVVT